MVFGVWCVSEPRLKLMELWLVETRCGDQNYFRYRTTNSSYGMSVQQRSRTDEEGQMKIIATRLRNSGDVCV